MSSGGGTVDGVIDITLDCGKGNATSSPTGTRDSKADQLLVPSPIINAETAQSSTPSMTSSARFGAMPETAVCKLRYAEVVQDEDDFCVLPKSGV